MIMTNKPIAGSASISPCSSPGLSVSSRSYMPDLDGATPVNPKRPVGSKRQFTAQYTFGGVSRSRTVDLEDSFSTSFDDDEQNASFRSAKRRSPRAVFTSFVSFRADLDQKKQITAIKAHRKEKMEALQRSDAKSGRFYLDLTTGDSIAMSEADLKWRFKHLLVESLNRHRALALVPAPAQPQLVPNPPIIQQLSKGKKGRKATSPDPQQPTTQVINGKRVGTEAFTSCLFNDIEIVFRQTHEALEQAGQEGDEMVKNQALVKASGYIGGQLRSIKLW